MLGISMRPRKGTRGLKLMLTLFASIVLVFTMFSTASMSVASSGRNNTASATTGNGGGHNCDEDKHPSKTDGSDCDEDKKISICHATGSNSNPYVLIKSISKSGVYHGHLGSDHQNGEDIIPPFEYKGHTYYQNWDANGQAIYANKCVVEEEPPTCETDPTMPGCDEEPPPCVEECPVPDTVHHSKGNLRCVGTVRGGVYDNVRVPKDKTCNLIGVHVNKNVITDGARNVRILDTTVVRGIELTNVKNNIRIGNEHGCRYDPQVGRSITIIDSHNVLICEMTVCEDISIRGADGQVTVRHSSARRFYITNTHKLVKPYLRTHRHPEDIRLLDSRAKSLTAHHNHKSRELRLGGSYFGPRV